MKKLISILATMILLITCAAAENTDNEMIEGTENMMIAEQSETAIGTITISFDANITTGFEWTAFVIGGDSVEIDPDGSGYVSDAASDSMEVGVGGTHYFKLDAIQPGESIIRFVYARSWENEPMEFRYMHVMVDEDMTIYTTDVTESGVYDGVVTDVNAEDHSVRLETERLGEVIARFDENEALPVMDEHIVICTNGTMTMSLPPIVNVIAWSSEPSELGR